MSAPWLLALHSSSETLGIGLQPMADPAQPWPPARLEAFPLGRSLGNALLDCLESMLPASRWRELGRLSVATGPGGFTSTRMTVVLARTLAQQLALPLDGVGSFRLMARRLLDDSGQDQAPAFWLVQDLPRRGLVAGLYGADPARLDGLREWISPRLFSDAAAMARAAEPFGLAQVRHLPAVVSLPDDVGGLLELSQLAAASGQAAPWQAVLPIYPTSPVALS